MTDTPQQRAILRQSRTARAVRAKFPTGTRVRGRDSNTDAPNGTVVRHVPAPNGQGGHLTVEWDNGRTGRHSAISLVIVTES